VVQAVQTASDVMAELAKAADADEARLKALAADFMQSVAVGRSCGAQHPLHALHGAVGKPKYGAFGGQRQH
jgi:hypothetical protein